MLSFIQRIKTLVCKDCFLCCTVRAVKLTQCYFWAKCITSCRASHFSPTFGSLRNLQEVVIFLFCYCHASALLYNAWWGVCIVHRASLSLEESYEALKSLKFDSQRSFALVAMARTLLWIPDSKFERRNFFFFSKSTSSNCFIRQVLIKGSNISSIANRLPHTVINYLPNKYIYTKRSVI